MVKPRRERSTAYVQGMDEGRLFGSEAYQARKAAQDALATEDDRQRPHPAGGFYRRASNTRYSSSKDTAGKYRALDKLREGMYNTASSGETETGKQLNADAVNLAELLVALDQFFSFRDGLFAKEAIRDLGLDCGPKRLRKAYEGIAVLKKRPADVAQFTGFTRRELREIERVVTERLVDIIFD